MSMEAVIPQTDTPVLGALIEERLAIKAAYDELNRATKEKKRELDAVEFRLLEALDALGTETARAHGHTVAVNESVKGNIADYDEFIEFVRDNDAWFLLERRISNPAFREMLAERDGEDIPGLTAFNRRTVSVRKV